MVLVQTPVPLLPLMPWRGLSIFFSVSFIGKIELCEGCWRFLKTPGINVVGVAESGNAGFTHFELLDNKFFQ